MERNEKQTNKHVLVIGSINVDYVIHTERLPKLGETLNGSDFSMNFGGKGANQAVALAKAGCEVKMLGAVGKDLPGSLAVTHLQEAGVDTSAVFSVDKPTGAAVITVCCGDNHILLDSGANGTVTPQAIVAREDLFDWAEIVVMQYEIPIESVLCAARLAKEKGKTVIVNPAPAREVPTELYEYTDLIIPNEFEAEGITGIAPKDDEDAVKVLTKLCRLGCKGAIVTLGERGSAYSENGEVGFMGIYPVRAVDSTAAGDSFIGGLCARLCGGASLREAIEYAAAVSAITVERKGASDSIPTEQETLAFLKEHCISRSESVTCAADRTKIPKKTGDEK